MKILITGGAGFIGSHLAERLHAQGHNVVIFDREPWFYPDFSFIPSNHIAISDCREIHDLASPVRHAVNRFKPDFIYHLAATVGVKRVLADPKECIENNIDSLRAVLSLGVPGLFTSTSEVYGKTTETVAETSPLLWSSATRWAYAASKLTGEYLAKAAGWKTVRLFNVVGPRQNMEYGAVLPRFVSQALAGGPITVYGDGKQVRTFLDVRDCVRILDELRDKEFDVVNVGGAHTLPIRYLAQTVSNAIFKNSDQGRGASVKFVPYQDAYPDGFEECERRVPDLSKLRSLVGDLSYLNFSDTILSLAESLKGESLCHSGQTTA